MSEYESSTDASVDEETFTLEEVYVDAPMNDRRTNKRCNQLVCKREGASPYPKEEYQRRPGRTSSRRDEDLNTVELERLQRRRERNRSAASRCRDRRMKKITDLEGQVTDLTSAKDNLLTENKALQKEIEQLQFEVNTKMTDDTFVENTQSNKALFPSIKQLGNLPVETPKTAVLFTPGGTFSLTALQSSTVFNFPVLANGVNLNTDSLTEFTKTLAIL